MAKQKGAITFTGTMAGVNFYFRNGVPVARMAGGGFNGDAIRKSPKMQRVRENGSEFGMVSKAKKLFRIGLHSFLMDYADVTMHGRLMRLFQEIKVLDTVSSRGERRFENGLTTDEGRSLLMHFDLTAKKASIMLPGKGHYDAGLQRYLITDIKPKDLHLPKGATGMQLCFGILQADFAAGSWKFHKSPEVFMDAAFEGTTLTLRPDTSADEDGIRIAVLQVRFYQEVNGKRFLHKEMGMQGLEVVGVD